METNNSTDYFSIHPPKLEDAGLEDPALPIEGIQEAFRRVADLVQMKATTSSDEEMEDTLVDPLPEPEDEDGSCVDPVIDGMVPLEDVIVNPPEQFKEDLVLEKEEKGPKLGKEKCVIGDADPIQDIQATF
eukprot:c22168_g1_i1 orf=454-846(-)